jgi:drug/metabolite transporter (DMT)-like permease
VGALLALLSSALWGTADFLGGSLSRRAHPLLVMRAAQSVSLLAMVLIVVLSRSLGGPLDYLPFAIGAGVTGMIGLSSFYAALASGTMGVVAPIAGLGVVVPVGVGVADGDRPAAIQVLGIVVAVAGAILVSGPERAEELDQLGRAERRRPLVLAAFSALAFGLALTFMARGSDTSTIMTILVMRATNVALAGAAILLIARRSGAALRGPTRSDGLSIVAIATTDTTANACYGVATQSSLLSLAAVLGSLYPAMTSLLAWRFHHERLAPMQKIGVGLVLFGVAAIAAG